MPSPAPLRSELRVVLEPLRLARRAPSLRKAPKGSGPVLVIPGFRTTDRSTMPLRRFLRGLGYDAVGWGLGVNQGGVDEPVEALLGTLGAMDGPAAIVGWSWGGVLARVLARRAPEAVSQVVTLGSPLTGGVRATAFGRRVSDEDQARSAAAAARREAPPLPVPCLSIYTRRDAVVAWEASVDPVPGRTEHAEVDSCHLGLGLNPDVWLILAERLARTADSG